MSDMLKQMMEEIFDKCEMYKFNDGCSRATVYFYKAAGIGFICEKRWYATPESEQMVYCQRADSLIDLIKYVNRENQNIIDK